MNQLKNLSVALVVSCGLSGAAFAAPEASAPPAAPAPAPTAVTPLLSINTVCAGEAIPEGWVKIDDMSDTSKRCKSTEKYNVWLIQDISAQPVGSTVEICTVKVVPMRWFMAQSKWDAKKCGHPATQTADNVMVIKRAH